MLLGEEVELQPCCPTIITASCMSWAVTVAAYVTVAGKSVSGIVGFPKGCTLCTASCAFAHAIEQAGLLARHVCACALTCRPRAGAGLRTAAPRAV